MITLNPEQTQALLALLGSTKSFLSSVETTAGHVRAVRDSLIDDCDQWKGVIMRKIDQTRG